MGFAEFIIGRASRDPLALPILRPISSTLPWFPGRDTARLCRFADSGNARRRTMPLRELSGEFAALPILLFEPFFRNEVIQRPARPPIGNL